MVFNIKYLKVKRLAEIKKRKALMDAGALAIIRELMGSEGKG